MSVRLRRTLIAALAPFLALGTATHGLAQTDGAASDPRGALAIELNRSVQTDNGCRLGFVTNNGLDADLSKTGFEVVLFNQEGLIERLLVLDFGEMAAGRTKVREFNLAGTQCDAISRVLVNDVSACEGEGLDPTACTASLKASSKSDIEFGL